MSYLIYNTEAEAIAAERTLYVNRIKSIASDDRFLDAEKRPVTRAGAKAGMTDTKDRLLDDRTKQWVESKDLTDDDMNDRDRFHIYGMRQGKLMTDEIGLTGWDTPRQVDNGTHAGKWAIQEPEGHWAQFMTGLPRPSAKSTSKTLFNEVTP